MGKKQIYEGRKAFPDGFELDERVFRIFAQGFPIDFYCATSRRGQ
jgi:hypothetical protein